MLNPIDSKQITPNTVNHVSILRKAYCKTQKTLFHLFGVSISRIFFVLTISVTVKVLPRTKIINLSINLIYFNFIDRVRGDTFPIASPLSSGFHATRLRGRLHPPLARTKTKRGPITRRVTYPSIPSATSVNILI